MTVAFSLADALWVGRGELEGQSRSEGPLDREDRDWDPECVTQLR